MSLRERLLIRRLRERDENAFREVVRTYQNRVYNVTYRMLGNATEAEDVAQEVFITVFKSIDSFRGESKLSTWLYRIAANQCKNRLKYLARRHDRERKSYNDEVDGTGLTAGGVTGSTVPPQPDARLQGVEREQIVQAAIARLPEEHRLLIVLRDIEELAYGEICAISGLPEGTVKSRLHRARLSLRKQLLRLMAQDP